MLESLLPLVVGVILEFILRKIKTKNRKSLFLVLKKALNYSEIGLKVLGDAVGYVEEKSDVIVKQNLKGK